MKTTYTQRLAQQIDHPPTQYLADSAWGIHYAAAEDRLKEAEADAPVLG